jgi:hypothetical protein
MANFEEMVPGQMQVELAGKKWILSVLRLSDHADAAKEMRKGWTPIRDVLQSLKDLGEEDRKHVLTLAYRDERQGNQATTDDVFAWYQTPAGMLFRYWLAFRRCHPEITLEEVDELVLGVTDADFTELDRTEGQMLGNSPSPPEMATAPVG